MQPWRRNSVVIIVLLRRLVAVAAAIVGVRVIATTALPFRAAAGIVAFVYIAQRMLLLLLLFDSILCRCGNRERFLLILVLNACDVNDVVGLTQVTVCSSDNSNSSINYVSML